MGESSENAIEVAEDDSWVFESLVNFLHGPIWKLPVMGFVEEKSVVFDPDSYRNMTEEKEQEYRKIHEQYKGLVDFMLANFMEDIQVTPEQVESACKIRETNVSQVESQVTKVALEQLWAAEDFNTFRRLLTRKNIDLQLVTLELLVSKYGVLSPSLRNPDSHGGDETTGEDEFLQVVMRYTNMYNVLENEANDISTIRGSNPPLHPTYSLECESKKSHSHDSQPKCQTITTMHSADSTTPVNTLQLCPNPKPHRIPNVDPRAHSSFLNCTAVEHPVPETLADRRRRRQIDDHELEETPISSTTQLESTKKIQKPSVSKTISTAASVESKVVVPERQRLLQVKQALELRPTDDLEMDSAVETDEYSDLSPATAMMAIGTGNEEDIRRRREYMRDQRDKLMELKRKEREKQLNDESFGSETQHAKSRPKSSKAARIAYANSQAPVPANERSIAARRALANRLKQELNMK